MTDLLKALNWRYATKKFDATKKVSNKDFEQVRHLVPYRTLDEFYNRDNE